MIYVIKRDKTRELFDIKKIAIALNKVFDEIHKPRAMEDCLDMAHYITTYYHEAGMEDIDIEAIQDDVEMYLIEMKEVKAFKAYNKYREIQDEMRNNPWDDLSPIQEAVIKKYLDKKETKKDFLVRMSMGDKDLYKMLVNREFIFAGRINAAYKLPYKQSGSNCYVQTDPEDNLFSIHETDYKNAVTYSKGGGSGANMSNLRPVGAFVNNAARETTGVVSFAEQYSATTLRIGQKHRRGALMLMLNSDHPDIINWIKAKLDIHVIQGANLSIYVQDAFMEAATTGEMWELKFETEHEKISRWVLAEDVLSLMAFTNWWSGDPGMFWGDRANSWHLLSEYGDVHFTCTNPCGEQPLMGNGSCNLASVNYANHILDAFDKNARIAYDRVERTIRKGIRALDSMLDYFHGSYPLPAQNDHITKWREIGLGFFGYADMAVKLGVAYGSEEFNAIVGDLMSKSANWAAQESAMIAKERGVFPEYDFDLISASTFYQEVYTDETKALIEQYGLAHSRLLTIAPNGSIGTLHCVSTGGEPFFAFKYTREVRAIGDEFGEPQFIDVFEKTIQDLMNHLGIHDVEDLPEYAKVDANSLKPMDRIKFQQVLQKYVDTAISSTINLPHETTWQEIKEIYIQAWKHGLKGITVFRDNCAKMGILTTANAKGFEFQVPPVHEIPFLNKEDIKIILDPDAAKEFIDSGNLCPECGATIIKKDGCIGCSSCYWSKCSI